MKAGYCLTMFNEFQL